MKIKFPKTKELIIKYKELISYLFFGGCSFLLNVGTFALFNKACHLNEHIANIISWIITIIFVYITNKLWVFESNAKNYKEISLEFLKFVLGRVFTLLLEEAIIFIFITKLQYNSIVIKVIAQIVVIVSNYIISKLLVFTDCKNNNSKKYELLNSNWNYISLVLSFLSCIGCYCYFFIGVVHQSSSFLIFALFILLYKIWKSINRNHSVKYFACWLIFSFVFATINFSCKYLDQGLARSIDVLRFLFGTLSFTILVYPFILSLCEILLKIQNQEITICSKNFKVICFTIICVFWFFGYLAAFPGIYTTDANTWYHEFADKNEQVSSQWSPLYAFLFYFFVHTGYVITGKYEVGFAVFTFVQMSLILIAVYKILDFSQKKLGKTSCVLTSLFFLLPTHIVVAAQTIQAAPFMACFSIVFLEIIEIIEFKDKIPRRHIVILTIFVILSGMFRDNGYLALLLLIPFSFIFNKGNARKAIVFSLIIGVLCTGLYKKVLLPTLGVKSGDKNGTSLSTMIGVPLQQLSCTYNHSTKLSSEEKDLIEKYITKQSLDAYLGIEGINDQAKMRFNEKLFKENPMAFIGLYLKVGLKCPREYSYAFFMQNLGILYIDKYYPEPNIWHPFLAYTNYWYETNGNTIGISRIPLLKSGDKVLLKLFGDTSNGFGGFSKAIFAKVPFLGSLCKVSLYFWLLIFLTCFAIYRKRKSSYLILALCLIFTLTILLAPLITYRYYAPIIFVMPVVTCCILKREGV